MRARRTPQAFSVGASGDNRTGPAGGPAGYTLVELLVTVLVLVAAIAMPALSLGRSIARMDATASARVCESALVTAQTYAIWGGSPADLSIESAGFLITAGGTVCTEAPPVDAPHVPLANVARWRRPASVRVGFLPGFGSPDAAGSLYFGNEGNGERVIVRLESGLTRRIPW